MSVPFSAYILPDRRLGIREECGGMGKTEPKSGYAAGLTSKEAAALRKTYGENTLGKGKKPHPFAVFVSQFKDFLTLVLLGGTAVSVAAGEYAEAVSIAVIVLLNGIMSFVQEYRAEKTLDALKSLAAPKAKVWRDGELVQLDAGLLVPGDLVRLEAGDRVPADGAVTESAGLSADESMLSGESVAVPKTVFSGSTLPENEPDRRDTVYMGTVIVSGNGQMTVTATGMSTQMGKIAGMLSEIPNEQTPLQKRLDQLGKYIAVGCLIICALVAGTGVLRGEDIRSMLMVGISLAVAAVPEGLPAIVTISLALAVRRMVAKNALLRRLSAVETLGCADVICTDKTGTLTTNRMEVTALWCRGKMLMTGDKDVGQLSRFSEGREALTVFTLCSDVSENASGIYQGDPTETALCRAAEGAGLVRRELMRVSPRIDEIPFDSVRKRMSVIVRKNGERFLLCKGGCDCLLDRCSRIRMGETTLPLSPELRKKVTAACEEMAGKGLRVLAAAEKTLDETDRLTEDAERLEQGMTFLGLAGMIDPPRKEVRGAVALCRRAGIRPVMITGDHQLTARAIAQQVGICQEGGKILTGRELDQMSEEERLREIPRTSVFARVSPRHKLMIVRTLGKLGSVTAMTGDGVNDAPAVREADIGVSMGISGTDVTREASDLILMDDNFATLVSAVEEGRAIYQNIRAFIRYLLACNIGEVLTMFLGMLMGMPVVLSPIHILIVNLVTDGLPAIALGLEPAEKGLMEKRPRGKNEGIFARGLLGKILFRGSLIGLTSLFVFSCFLAGGEIIRARTAAFVTLVFCQLFHVFECRSETKPIWKMNPFGNIKLIGAVGISALITILSVWLPPMNTILGTVPLKAGEMLFILVCVLFAPILSALTDRLWKNNTRRERSARLDQEIA